MRRLLPCVTALLVLSSAGAAEPLLEKIDLFEAGTDGYALYRIPGLVVTKKGTVLAYCEARRTGKSDWDTIDIMMRRSTDGGKTWSERRKVAEVPGPHVKNPVALAQKLANPDDVTYNNPLAIADASGAVHFLFCLEYCRCFYSRSEDDGVTWTTPIEITSTFEQFRPEYEWKVLATGPGHGIQLRHGAHQGRLVVPVWLSTGTGGHAHRPSVASVVYSDDGGKSWQRGDIAAPNTDEWVFPSETVVVELNDGRVMLNLRSESRAHRRLVTLSPDGATRWTRPRFDDALWEPICMGSIVRFSKRPEHDKNRILFANPHNLDRIDGKAKEGGSRDRRNLSIKLSYDEGRTWPVNKSLEPGYSAYSDLGVLPDGTVLCFYERGREADAEKKKPTSYAGLVMARFDLAWLTDGKDTAILHVHGDADQTVPLEKNSAVIDDRYRAFGGPMELIVIPARQGRRPRTHPSPSATPAALRSSPWTSGRRRRPSTSSRSARSRSRPGTGASWKSATTESTAGWPSTACGSFGSPNERSCSKTACPSPFAGASGFNVPPFGQNCY